VTNLYTLNVIFHFFRHVNDIFSKIYFWETEEYIHVVRSGKITAFPININQDLKMTMKFELALAENFSFLFLWTNSIYMVRTWKCLWQRKLKQNWHILFFFTFSFYKNTYTQHHIVILLGLSKPLEEHKMISYAPLKNSRLL